MSEEDLEELKDALAKSKEGDDAELRRVLNDMGFFAIRKEDAEKIAKIVLEHQRRK